MRADFLREWAETVPKSCNLETASREHLETESREHLETASREHLETASREH